MHLLADMAFFVELAKFQNFSRAASALQITASTLSRRMKALEEELGVSLIRRSTRSFALTDSGQQFLERAEKILADAIRAREEVGASFSRVSGHLRIGSPFDLAATVLGPLCGKFCREHTGVSLEIVASQGQPDLIADSLDLAFVVAHQMPLRNSSFPARAIGSFPRMLYASKLYLKRQGSPAYPQDLKQHTCIRHIYGNNSTEKFWELSASAKRREKVAVDGTCASGSIIVAALAAREHLGVAMLPQHMATHPTFGAGLVRVLPDWEGAKAYVFALSPNRAIPAKAQELINVIKADFCKRLAQLEAVS